MPPFDDSARGLAPAKAGIALAALLAGATCIALSPIWVRVSETGPTAAAFWRVALASPGLWLLRPVARGPALSATRAHWKLLLAAGVAVALLGYKSFVTNLSYFLDVLLVLFIPWSAVNLADYFIIRRARYDVAAFFAPGGAYGNVAWRGLLAYAAGLAAGRDFVPWLRGLKAEIDIEGPLSRHGVERAMLPRLVDIALADVCQHTNPRPCTAADFERLFEQAL